MKYFPVSALFTDRYQLTMIYAHWKNGSHHNRCAFDLYFRSLPFGNGYAVVAGLQRSIEYLQTLQFSEEEITYLQSIDPYMDPQFFNFLRDFRFNGDMYAIPEGTIVFANEPLLRVEGTIIELQLIETALLNFIGYQTLIATKAARIRRVCSNDPLMEFGTRRAQEMDAAIWGARASYISGFDSTSNLLAGKRFDIPTSGTHSHSWVQSFSTESDAFQTYAHARPDNSILLVDTYDTLQSGLPHAIEVGLKLKKRGLHLSGIRLDSGDLALLSKQARRMLDEAGLFDTRIIASSDLDEYAISQLKSQDAKIDAWGIGTRLITAYDQPALGIVYKMVSRMQDSTWIPTIKISSNPDKITTPGRKKVYRLIAKATHKAYADLVMDISENILAAKKLKEYTAFPLLVPIFKQGTCTYELPHIEQIRDYHQRQLNYFKEEILRIKNPEEYVVHFSEELLKTKKELLKKKCKEFQEKVEISQ